MPLFPSQAWCEAAVRVLNADPETVHAGAGWTGDFGLVVEAERGALEFPFTVYCRPVGGRVTTLEVLPDPDDLDGYEPAYRIRAPYSVWKGLLRGSVDPVEAVLRRRLLVEGDVQPLLERMKYKGVADRVLRGVETTFVDEA